MLISLKIMLCKNDEKIIDITYGWVGGLSINRYIGLKRILKKTRIFYL